MQGLAPDGGLYVPSEWPEISDSLNRLESFADFAAEFLSVFFAGDALCGELGTICATAFNFPLELRGLDADTSVLELFHGPTLAFKDFGARFLARSLHSRQTKQSAMTSPLVMVATSGDTGGAVASAFAACTEIPVVILFPEGRISERQEKQLTVWGNQIRAYAVRGTFDDCQRMVKEALQSPEWRARFDLLSANSINIARLLPQMAYFAWASLQYLRRNGKKAGVLIPTGNAGNAVGALWARLLGFPIREVVFAHNANRTVPDYFASGDWRPRPSVGTLANAMDVGNPSNFERVLDLYPEREEMREFVSAVSVTDEEIKQTIVAEYESSGNIFCPHTATAVHARRQRPEADWIVVATAHPSKFEAVIEPLLGKPLLVPEPLAQLLSGTSLKKLIAPDLQALKDSLFQP
jgi:threonine synthase